LSRTGREEWLRKAGAVMEEPTEMPSGSPSPVDMPEREAGEERKPPSSDND
jgi:hypothetical protein